MEKPMITEDCVKTIAGTRFVSLYDLQYAEGKHYYNASRRKTEDLVCVKSDEEFRTMLPDAVSCIVVLKTPADEPRLLLFKEFRYPAGQYLLSVPAGLVDPEDKEKEEPLVETAIREIREETGLEIKETDRVRVVNPFVFCTPGMTDESNGFVVAEVNLQELPNLNHDGAVGTECFEEGFSLITVGEAREILKNGRDNQGIFLPMHTWVGLLFFVSGLWENL